MLRQTILALVLALSAYVTADHVTADSLADLQAGCSDDITLLCEQSKGSPRKDDCQTILDNNIIWHSGCGSGKSSSRCNTDGKYNSCQADACQQSRYPGTNTCLPESQSSCQRLYQSYIIGNCTSPFTNDGEGEDGETYERTGGSITVNDANGKGNWLRFQFSMGGGGDEGVGCGPLDLCTTIETAQKYDWYVR